MMAMMLPPYPRRRTTFHRWWKLASRPESSLLRLLEYDHITGLRFDGLSLDVGGEERSGYYRLLSIGGSMHRLNVDLRTTPSYLADLNRSIPAATGSYHNVLSFNTLEHIYADTVAVAEMYRVLKPGGHLYFTVPFLYGVHGSPDDYHRHTASFWKELLTSVGFPESCITIQPLAFGGAAAPLSFVEFLVPSQARRLLRAVVLLVPLAKTLLRPDSGTEGAALPLGYFIMAQKPGVIT